MSTATRWCAGRVEEGRELFEKLLGLCNDVGLLSEEYDASSGLLVGNYPQALSHIALVNTAIDLHRMHGPVEQRADAGGRAAERWGRRTSRGYDQGHSPAATNNRCAAQRPSVASLVAQRRREARKC
ncbi:glycoside hydrolase family 15 protein [Streptomonospora wellingtoniae]|uniref:Glycoside hydrolase family 15 protein n=1 Tax=Streptomonospora wellingtoniae TaxID=3075544 RepID=A0ABU2KWL4_9ACTN|nr:glycoside hydrolase family 15 protein [Streptomonospora sp. DSM 45055]MDT0303694.1 glycoside hydrolase family 15 protein [Streptomonospora sp. DSM 45055]